MDGFRFEYDPGVIRAGPGSAAALGDELGALGCERALVVTGRTVGRTAAVRDPVVDGLGDSCAAVFAETTPEKRLDTARAAVAAMLEADADALVGLGGGSSLDVATVASVLAATDRAPAAVERELRETGTIRLPAGPLPPVVAVPTTLAGADLSAAAGLTADVGGERLSGSISDPRLMPSLACYDWRLFETTPPGVLRASAMNGFDKGVETLYAAAATPITDATASRALERLCGALPTLGRERPGNWDLSTVVEGIVLAQYGVSRPDASTLSAIHAVGHGLRTVAGVHQGRAHAAVAPHVLRDLFEQVDGRRALLADALGVPDDADQAAGVVDAVVGVRDALGLPDRLRALDALSRDDLDDVARAAATDRLLENAPPGYGLDAARAAEVLRAAW